MAKAEGWPKRRRLRGTRIKRLDGPAKATGYAKYSYDINRKGMLHGAILRSPYAHARIKSIDTSAARKTPGFKALAFIGIARDWQVVSTDGDKVSVKTIPGKKKAKEEARTNAGDSGATLLRANKAVKLADLKAGDRVTVENEKDIIGKELF